MKKNNSKSSIPNLEVDLSARRMRNLAVLQKIDSNVLEIIGDSTHVALYTFDAASSKWERMSIEGACFITRCAMAPMYNIMVLNKMGPDDFKLDIKCIMNIKVQSPYLMLRHSTSGAPCIVGLWFHDEAERDDMMVIISKAMKSAAGQTNSSIMVSSAGDASSSLNALKMLLSAPVSAESSSSLTPPAVSAPTPSQQPPVTPAAPKQSAGAMLLASLKGGAAVKPVSTSPVPTAVNQPAVRPIPSNDSVFLTDREIAARGGGNLWHSNNRSMDTATTNTSSTSTSSNSNGGGDLASSASAGSITDGGVNALTTKLKSLLKGAAVAAEVSPSVTPPPTAAASAPAIPSTPITIPPSAPVPTPMGVKIPVSALFAASSIASNVPPTSVPVPIPLPEAAPAPVLTPVTASVPLPVPVSAFFQIQNPALLTPPVLPAPTPSTTISTTHMLLSPSDLTGMKKNFNSRA